MTRRLLNSVKNERARQRYIEKLAKANLANMGAVNKEIDRQANAWQDGPSAGGDVVYGDREAPTMIFRPRKGGGGKFFDPQSNEVQAKDDAEERSIAATLRASGGTGTAKTGADFDAKEAKRQQSSNAAEAGRAGGRDRLRQAGLGGLADLAQGAEGLSKGADWLFEEQGKEEAPKNLGQWLVNLLSTGTYVTARAAEGVGAAAEAVKQREKENGPSSLSGVQGLAESFINAGGGAARGVAEGLGFRFDGERPRTWGQNLEAVGTADALRGALGEDAGNVAQGALGTVADVGLDPTTYLTLGATGAARGAKEGAQAAAALGKTPAGKVARGVRGGVTGAFEGMAKRRAEIALQRASASEARSVRRAAKRGDDIAGTGFAPQLELEAPRTALDDAVEEGIVEDPRLFVGAENGDVFQPHELDLRNPQLALPAQASDYRPGAASVEQVQNAARLLDPTLRATDELTPSLLGTVAPPKLNPARLLAGGSRAVTTKVPLIDNAGSAAMSSQITGVRSAVAQGADVERAIQGAMGQLERVPSVAARMDTIADNQGSTVRDLIEAAMRGNDKAATQVSKLWRRQIDETAQVVNTPALREAIDAVAPGLRSGLGFEKAKLHRLVSKLNRTGDPTAQQEILQQALGRSYQRGYAGFGEALAGAGRGEIEPEQMAQMLSALGVKTRATSPASLRNLLATKGAASYEEALAKIPTPEAVRATYNLSDETAARMATVDVDEVAAATQRDAEQAISDVEAPEIADVDFPATDPEMPLPKPPRKPKAPKPEVTASRTPSEFTGHDFDASGPGRNQNPNPVGKAAYAGVRALGRLLREATEEGKRGNTLTSYTDEVSTQVHRAVVEQLKMPYLKKGGADRAERFLPRWLEAMNVVDAWARGKGMFPHLVDNENGTGPIWVSPAQVLELLDPKVVGAALFAPVKTRSSRASEEAIGYVNGMTVYPNHVMSGLKVALSGGTPEQVAKIITDRAVGASKGMQRGTDRYVKAFVETKEGRAALADLSAAMTDPRFLDQVHAIDARVRPVAEAVSQRYIDNVVERAGARLIETLKDGGDRGTLMKVLDEVTEWADDVTRPALLESDRISATVRERLNSAIVKGILGEDGFLTAKHDWAFANALETMSGAKLADAQASALRREQARLDTFRPAAPGARDDLRPHGELVQERGRVAVAAEEFVDDAFERMVADVEAELGTRYADLPEELYTEADARIAHGLAEKVGSFFSGKFGQADLWAGRVAAEEGTLAQAAHYTDKMMRWIDTVAARMSETRGVKVKPQEALDHLNGPIFRALAATDPEAWGSTGRIYTELRAGRSMPDPTRPATTDMPMFAALDDFDAKLGVEMMKFIDHVFNPNPTGMLGRSGLAAEDLVAASRWHLRGDFEAYKLDPGEALTEQAQKWRAWGGAESPLDIIDRTHRAIQAALVPQQIGHQMAPLFGHKALAPGRSTKELYAEGWRRIDVSEARGLGRFIDPDAYFPPYVLKQIRHVDDFLAASRGFDPDSGLGHMVRAADAITHTLKSMNTIWRPGHHVTNVLGELGMLVMAGVNPLQVRRGIRAIQAGGGAVDADMSMLDDIVRQAQGGKAPKEKYAKDTVDIVLRDGRGGHRIEQVPLKTVWEWAVNSGVALTHTAARDLMGDLSAGVARNVWNSNPLARADQTLGQFSATRDNVTRLAHFIDGLEKGTFANIDQARNAAVTKVHDYHPTVRTLSRGEQKYLRRLVFFYTWVRQAVSRVIRTAMDQPGYVTMPFKAQYNMAEANGLNPESIGGPTTDDPRTMSYTDNALLGPTLGLPGAEGEPNNLWAWSLSSPQIDTLQALFGTFNQQPATGNPLDDVVNNVALPAWRLAGDVANPLLTIPGDTVNGYTTGTKGFSQVLSESAGLPTALARSIPAGALSGDPEAGSIYSELFPKSAGAKKTPEEQQSEMGRYLLNLVTGLKFQNTTATPKKAKQEQREMVKRKLAEQGIDDPDVVTDLNDALWEHRLATETRG